MSLESQKNIVTEEVNTNVESTKLSDIRESDSDDERCKKCEDKEKEKDKDKDKDKCKDKEKDKEKKDKKYCVGDEIKKIYDKLEDCMLDIKINIPDMKEDMVICGFIKKKSEDNCNWRRFKAENRCKRDEESIISSLENSRRI